MTPLEPLRTIPMLKRPLLTTSDPRKKQRTSTPDSEFKIPSLPIRRALTPSTSTVAASSSPPRLSSPAREEMAIESVTVHPGSSFIFGRHRHKASEASSSSISLRSAIPTHLHHLVADLNAPSSIIYLSRYASHASRTHALVEYNEEKGLNILVIGQNGMKIAGKRALSGQRIEIRNKDQVTLDFYGTRVGLVIAEKEKFEPIEVVPEDILRAQLFTPDLSSPAERAVSLPPSSPPLAPSDVDMEEPTRAVSPLFSRDSSPLSTPSDEEPESSDAEPEPSDPVEEEVEEGPAEIPSPSREKSVKRELLDAEEKAIDEDPIPSDVDLPALLASTVVFSGSSKLSLPDLVKHMLDSQPSLRDVGEESRWLNWAGSVLENNPMFGKVQRHGKDASGHPLLPHFFYNPANDPDASRAAELGGLVRPLRTVQRAGGKAIDWRPVGSGRRRY